MQAGSIWHGELVGQESIMKENRSQKEPKAERELVLARYSWGKSSFNVI